MVQKVFHALHVALYLFASPAVLSQLLLPESTLLLLSMPPACNHGSKSSWKTEGFGQLRSSEIFLKVFMVCVYDGLAADSPTKILKDL